ncbi:unnamed protein product [Microthlaspi erraticum]|uniref:Large ribosomal subunit protein bL25 beta domain-containing protein n=1 Tax=Microthlaspi erraticum TaxID=1685480 RepID=A0A6D2K696_9BRAS|nr:unnamed protein product [Microthlaspi erraticum]
MLTLLNLLIDLFTLFFTWGVIILLMWDVHPNFKLSCFALTAERIIPSFGSPFFPHPLNLFYVLLGGSLNTIKRTVKYLCPAEIIPPYIEVDLSELDVGQKLATGDLKVHPALTLLLGKDEPVVKIAGGRVTDQKK